VESGGIKGRNLLGISGVPNHPRETGTTLAANLLSRFRMQIAFQPPAAPGYIPPEIPLNEADRLADLRELDILDTPAEERFDRIVRLTSKFFEAPISYVALVDEDRQWFKSRIGMEPEETPRESSFCGHAILQDEPLIVPDARKDMRFAGNPLVLGEPFVRFYAGQPLRSPGGLKVGTLCVLDRRPRDLTEKELRILHDLAQLVEHELALRDVIAAQKEAITAKEALAAAQEDLARTVRDLKESNKKAEQLLQNILPDGLAAELRTRGRVEPVHYEEACVLFADFCGFTKVASSMTPRELVDELNDCFCHFDWAVGRHGVEKLKTIGDGYLAAAGLPESKPDDALRLLRAAIEMRDFMRERQQEHAASGKPSWDVRIGLHAGPLVAGVVGVRKIAYDVWGDTVNTASRIESAGEPGRINVSAEFYERVRDQVTAEPRGQVGCKSKGLLEMFFIDSVK